MNKGNDNKPGWGTVILAVLAFTIVTAVFVGQLFHSAHKAEMDQEELARHAHVPADFPIHPTDLPTTSR